MPARWGGAHFRNSLLSPVDGAVVIVWNVDKGLWVKYSKQFCYLRVLNELLVWVTIWQNL